jgi:hypothetical protein
MVQSVRLVRATSFAIPDSGTVSDLINKCSPVRSSNFKNWLWSIIVADTAGLGEAADLGVLAGDGVDPAVFLDLNENLALGTSLTLSCASFSAKALIAYYPSIMWSVSVRGLCRRFTTCIAMLDMSA